MRKKARKEDMATASQEKPVKAKAELTSKLVSDKQSSQTIGSPYTKARRQEENEARIPPKQNTAKPATPQAREGTGMSSVPSGLKLPGSLKKDKSKNLVSGRRMRDPEDENRQVAGASGSSVQTTDGTMEAGIQERASKGSFFDQGGASKMPGSTFDNLQEGKLVQPRRAR